MTRLLLGLPRIGHRPVSLGWAVLLGVIDAVALAGLIGFLIGKAWR